MANETSSLAAVAAEEKAKLKQEKKQFKQDQKAQKKEARRRAAEIARQEEALGEDGGNGLVTFFATLLIVVLWLAIVGVVIKMDIGGFGSSVLAPILKDIPVVNKILPSTAPTGGNSTDSESYGGYESMEEAVAYIRQLELELEREQTASKAKDTENEALRAEVLRLKEFEARQEEFQRISTEFYEEVVYSEKGPGLDAYMKYYESMYPTVAEYLYKQGLVQQQKNEETEAFAQTYANMKPKEVAKIFEEMTNELDLVADILSAMTVEQRAAIMNVLDPELGAKLTKLMKPSS
ncbi:hypothetical protein NSB25_15335 [Acetatifactor muris]|uniref:MgtE intracellular N domain protein n=1 Tax=Acetatifactor muris TaxID=879566 RepID=A0A2K4ZIK1_9FIRM|nr:hypothetical protein [Acetatifactor muris]MCR2048650.1 hypothetical protein [Acetatifactor muris]SOY30290.1 hypothetical protein AMURIS_03017 [Acetatifactor muris]